jgi:hypothetical protein
MTQPPHDIFNHARLRSSEMRDDAFKSRGVCLNHESQRLRRRFRTRVAMVLMRHYWQRDLSTLRRSNLGGHASAL